MNLKKTLASLVLVVPLTFVAACGSGDGGDDATGTTSAVADTTETTEVTEAPETTGTTETTEATGTEEESASEEPAAEEESPADPEPSPGTGGVAASEADRAEIESLVRGVYEVETFHQFVRYIPENTCRENQTTQGGVDALDMGAVNDQRLADMPNYAAAAPYIESVTDVRVDGDRASAVVTAVSNGQADTRTQRYLREDGRWKFCP